MIGETISHYRVLDKLGEGGMGVVYRARDEQLHREVALKVLPARTLLDAAARGRFHKEAIALAKLNHPNIEAVYEFDSKDGIDFLVTEFVPGSTLDQQMKATALTESTIVHYGIQITSALEEAHHQGVIHCDLKPSNIMVTPNGQVKLLDFGLARILRIDDMATTVTAAPMDQVAGTLPYMAPEVLRGEAADERTDIYAAGVVLYELATGQRPFSSPSAAQLIGTILSQSPLRPGALNKAVGGALEATILKCLEKERSKRHQTARAVQTELRSIGDSEVKHGRISRRWTLGLSTAGLLAALLFGLWFGGSRPALPFSPRDWIFVSDFDNQSGEPIFDKSLATAFNVSLEQSRHANVFPRSRTIPVLRRMGKEKAARIDAELGREICLRENLRGLVSCSIAKVGQRYALSARLVNPLNGDTVRSYLEQADSQDEVLDALGNIAAAIRRDLGESLASVSQNDRPLARVTTPSLQALKYYSEASYLWSKGQYHDSLKLHQEAVRIDPDFAMGHRAIGIAYCGHIFNQKEKGRQHLERALQLSSRVSDRERLFIEIDHMLAFGGVNDAVQAYRSYLLAYPDDFPSRFSFGTVLMHNNRPVEAIEEFRQVVLIAPKDAGSHINLATSYSLLDKIPEALASYAKAFELEPSWKTSTNLNHEYGFAFVSAGNPGKAREIFDLAVADTKVTTRGLRSHAILDLYEGKYQSAAARLRESVRINMAWKAWLSVARDRLFLAIVHQGTGNRAEQLRELDAAWSNLKQQESAQVWLAARIGAALARAGALDKAGLVVQELSPKVNRKVGAEMADLHLLEAELLQARGDGKRAVEILSTPDLPEPGVLTLLGVARAYERIGNPEQAMAARADLIGKGGRMIGWEPQQDWIETHYLQAKAYAAKGDEAKASQLLAVIENLWKNADPGLPLLMKVQQLRLELQRR